MMSQLIRIVRLWPVAFFVVLIGFEVRAAESKLADAVEKGDRIKIEARGVCKFGPRWGGGEFHVEPDNRAGIPVAVHDVYGGAALGPIDGHFLAVFYMLDGKYTKAGKVLDGTVSDSGQLYLRVNGGLTPGYYKCDYTCTIKVWRE